MEKMESGAERSLIVSREIIFENVCIALFYSSVHGLLFNFCSKIDLLYFVTKWSTQFV